MAKIDIQFTDKGPDKNSTMRGGIVFDYTLEIEPRYRHDSKAKDFAEETIERSVTRALFEWVVENASSEMRSWYNRERRDEYVKTGR